MLSSRRCVYSVLCLRQRHQDRPDEATEFTGDGSDGDVTVLSLIKPEELFDESMLGLEGDGDDLGWLSLTAAIQDEGSTGVVTVVPGSLDQEAPDVDVAGLGDGPAIFSWPEECSRGQGRSRP